MISSLLPSPLRSYKVHWTLVLALGWLLAHSNRLTDQMVPSWAALTLIFGTLGLVLATAVAVRMIAKRIGLHASEWTMGPSGLFLPRGTQSLPTRSRLWLAAFAPAVYLAVGLATLPFLVQAGGLEGLAAAWDWWNWPMIAARFSFIALLLAAIQSLPFYPLSGAYLLEMMVGSRRFACRLSQLLTLTAGVVFWYVPLFVAFAIYCFLEAEAIAKRSSADERSDRFEPHLILN